MVDTYLCNSSHLPNHDSRKKKRRVPDQDKKILPHRFEKRIISGFYVFTVAKKQKGAIKVYKKGKDHDTRADIIESIQKCSYYNWEERRKDVCIQKKLLVGDAH